MDSFGSLLSFVRVRHLAVLLQPQRERAVLDLHVPQQDERARARGAQRLHPDGVLFAEAQQLVEVRLAVGVLHDVDDGPVEPHLHEHHAPRREVDRVVPELCPRQPRDERGVGIEQPHVGEDDARQQRSPDFTDVDGSGDHAFRGRARDLGEQRPARARADQRIEGAEQAGEEADQRPERDTQRAANHLERLSHRELEDNFLPERLAGPQGWI